MIDKLSKYMIIGVVASIAVVVGLIFVSGSFDNVDSNETSVDKKPTIISNYDAKTTATQQSSLYRINEQCEVLFAMSASVYPNDEPLQPLSLLGLVDKYPSDFKPWETIFSNENSTKAFLEGGLSPEFLGIFVDVVMREYSINPSLKSTAILAFLPDPTTGQKLQDLYEKNNCEVYYQERQNILE